MAAFVAALCPLGQAELLSPRLVSVNEIRVSGLTRFAGLNLTVFYVWTRPLLLEFEGSRPQPVRVLHPPVTTRIQADGTAVIPEAGVAIQFLEPTAVRLVVHEQAEVFLPGTDHVGAITSLPGDPRARDGGALVESDIVFLAAWDLRIRDHPSFLDSTAGPFNLDLGVGVAFATRTRRRHHQKGIST